MKKIVVIVPNLSSNKTKPSILKIVAELEGIEMIKFDEKKGTMTVMGSVDPVLLVEALRKKKKQANIASVHNTSRENENQDMSNYGYENYRGYGMYGPAPTAPAAHYMETYGFPVSDYVEPSRCTIL